MKSTEQLLEELKEYGATHTVEPDGKRIFLVLSHNLGPGLPQGLLISYEGKGSIFYEPGKHTDRFTLFAQGFSFMVAPTILDLLRDLFSAEAAQRDRKRLSDGDHGKKEGRT